VSHSGSDGPGRNTWNLRLAAKRSAENRRCPACARKSALVRVDEPGLRFSYCRWCGHECRARILPYPVETP